MSQEPITDKLLNTTANLMAGMNNLAEVTEVDVATAPKEKVWEFGKVKLYHYLTENPPKQKTPTLISYALVNRADMMDLQPDRSFIRRLLDEGADLYLIDWGYASRVDRYKTLDDYINGDIDDMVDFLRKRHDVDKVNLMGICQGGTFSVIYSALHPEKVKNLITLVTPIDFHVEDGLLFQWARQLDVDTVVDGFGGIVPAYFLNFGFDLLKPMSKVKKYIGLENVLADKAKMMNFLRMEKWVADGPDQAGETYRQFLKDMYQQNKLVKGEFELRGEKVDLKKIDMPVMNIYAAADHIVPPSATKPLNDHIGSKDQELYEFPGGHIGVFVGGRSQKVLAPAVAEFLGKRDK